MKKQVRYEVRGYLLEGDDFGICVSAIMQDLDNDLYDSNKFNAVRHFITKDDARSFLKSNNLNVRVCGKVRWVIVKITSK